MHDAAITCVHKLSQARLSSFMPTSTARFDCSASPKLMAPAGSNEKNTPAKAPRVPRKLRKASVEKCFISRSAEASPALRWSTKGVAASRSGSTMKTVTAAMHAATNTNPPFSPMAGIRNSTPAPPTALPIAAPPNITPLAKPRSSSCSVLTASASIATSCIAPKLLCTSSTAVNTPSCAGRSRPMQASSVTIIMICVPRIQPRRRPRRSETNTSMNGPKAHLKAQGR